MGNLNPDTVKAALMRGLAPLDQRVAALKSEPVTKAWEGFLRETTKQLLRGEITVDEWKGSLGDFATEAATVAGEDAEALVADANAGALAVEEAFDPPSPMRWLVVGGIAATAFAYWWLKREEKASQRFLVATPEIIAGTARRTRRPAIEVENVIEAEEI